MCLTCGCQLPYDDHENPKHLTLQDLEESAQADGLSLPDAVANLVETIEVIHPMLGHAHLLTQIAGGSASARD